jgi:UDP-GlcNAc:undecaprenyl-phosphate GlcNAc-1-phosphate transferase
MRSYLLAFLVSLALGALLTQPASRLARRIRALDDSHDPPLPRAGGLAIAIAAMSALAIIAAVLLPSRGLLADGLQRLWPAALGAAVILGLGVTDDVKRLRAAPKLAAEVLVAAGLWAAGIRIGTLFLPVGIVGLGEWVSLAATVAWIVGITNAFNLLDGIDGAAAGAATFALLAMFVTAVTLGQPFVGLVAVVLAGATLGFLPFNFPPARVYLGDAGSLLLGYSLAVLAIAGAVKGPAMVAIAIPLVAFGVPVLDTAIAVIRRAVRGAPVMEGDREHLHHRLLAIGLSRRQAAVVLYGVCAAFALASMLFLNPNVRGMAVVLTMVGVVVWFVVRHLRLHEFMELGRMAARGMQSTRAIGFNVQVRRAADLLEKTATWDETVRVLGELFGESEFDSVRLLLFPAAPGAPRREFRFEGGALIPRALPIAPDEWGLHLPFDVGRAGDRGELAVFRRYGRKALLTDVNLLVETLLPALGRAASRAEAPRA